MSNIPGQVIEQEVCIPRALWDAYLGDTAGGWFDEKDVREVIVSQQPSFSCASFDYSIRSIDDDEIMLVVWTYED